MSDAATALGNGNTQQARRSLERVLQFAPEHANARFLYGVACVRDGRSDEALTFLRPVAEQRPDDAMVQLYLGMALHDSGLSAEALACLRRACELSPKHASTWYNLGKALKQLGKIECAREALCRAVDVDDRHVLARAGLADIATIQGDITFAISEYRQLLKLQPDCAEAWYGLANLKTESLSSADVKQIRHALNMPGIHPDMRVALGFSLYKALEDQKDYVGAFDALRQANEHKRKMVDWDAASEHTHIERIIEVFTSPLPVPVDPTLGSEVIFVISMPRSGSTLVEHILASHPEVEGANEIPDLPDVIADESVRQGQPFPDWVGSATADDWRRLGEDYLSRTAMWRARHPRFTDKGLLNWSLIGAALAMLPAAKIVHCHRDPLENCFACYRQLFGHGMHFTYDLDDMASHYLDYQRLTLFWNAIFPDKIMDFPYEKLLDDPEERIRRLLEFCDLPIDAACFTPHLTRREVRSTASAAQVRRPITKSIPHGALYADQLQSLRQRLTGR